MAAVAPAVQVRSREPARDGRCASTWFHIVSGYARSDSSPPTGVGRRKRRAAETPRLHSPPRLTAHQSHHRHRAGPLRRQVRQGCQGPPLGRRRCRDGARDHYREAQAQVREEEHHREARAGGHRRLFPRQSGTLSGHIATRGDVPARPASKTPRVGSLSNVPDGNHAGVFRDVDRARGARTRKTRGV